MKRSLSFGDWERLREIRIEIQLRIDEARSLVMGTIEEDNASDNWLKFLENALACGWGCLDSALERLDPDRDARAKTKEIELKQ